MLAIATTNPSKYEQARVALAPLDVVRLDDLPHVDESADDAAGNARLKARTFAALADVPVLSTDAALRFDGLAEDEQPGVNVRRMVPPPATDERVLAHYADLVARNGGELWGCWEHAFAIAGRSGVLAELTVKVRRRFVAVSHPTRFPGQPLWSLQLLDDGRHIASLQPDELNAIWREIYAPVRELATGILSVRR